MYDLFQRKALPLQSHTKNRFDTLFLCLCLSLSISRLKSTAIVILSENGFSTKLHEKKIPIQLNTIFNEPKIYVSS